jgi:peptidoglycan/LPS O-acetylase OafA/YrhL
MDATLSAKQLAAAAVERDRYADLLRAASICVVVLGHWLMAVIYAVDGHVEFTNILGLVPGLWPATWVFQVMPIFFLVGGFANYKTLGKMPAKLAGYGAFVAKRVARLVKPVLVLLAVWIPLAAVLQALGLVGQEALAVVTVPVSQPLWFIGVYLIVTALAPPFLALHRRYRTAVPTVLLVAAAAVDLARLKGGFPHVGVLNVAFVWLLAQQLGFFYGDAESSLYRPPRAALVLLMLCCLGTLGVLTTIGPYPRSMVGLPGEQISNMNPPTVCLAILAVFQACAIMLVRGPASRALERPRLWLAVVLVNTRIMTIYLWHLTALLLVFPLVLRGIFPSPEPASLAWWVTRVPWVLLLMFVSAFLVVIFGRFELRPMDSLLRAAGSVRPLVAATAVAFVALGVLGIAAGGIVDFWSPHGRRLVVLPVSPASSVGVLLVGLALLRLGGAPPKLRASVTA